MMAKKQILRKLQNEDVDWVEMVPDRVQW